MRKLTVREAFVQGKRVLLRTDYNVPLENGRIMDDARIRATLPTLQFLLQAGAAVVLMSHVGRPKGKEPKLSLKPIAERLAQLLDRTVEALDDCVGPEVRKRISAVRPGDVVLLENLRFHPGEEKNDPAFAAELAALGDVYVNDGFGVSHRAHASVDAVPRRFTTRYAGLLMEKELSALGRLLENPRTPFVVVLGGAKVSDKIGVIDRLMRLAQVFLIGGAMAYTFLKSAGIPVGTSLVENDRLDVAARIRRDAEQRGVRIVLPRDHRVVKGFRDSLDVRVETGTIAPEWMGVDIGPLTTKDFEAEIARAETILWNGPLGAFEVEAFGKGTKDIARAIAANRKAVKVVGGGDTLAAVAQAGVAAEMTHISTGGGACLEFLEGKELPGVTVLTDA